MNRFRASPKFTALIDQHVLILMKLGAGGHTHNIPHSLVLFNSFSFGNQ